MVKIDTTEIQDTKERENDLLNSIKAPDNILTTNTNTNSNTIKNDKNNLNSNAMNSNEIDIDDLVFDTIDKNTDSDIINLNINDSLTDDDTDIDEEKGDTKDVFDLDIEELK